MRKKILTTLILMMMFALCACGNKEDKQVDTSEENYMDEYENKVVDNDAILVHCTYVSQSESVLEEHPRTFAETDANGEQVYYMYHYTYEMEDGTVLTDAEDYIDEDNIEMNCRWVLKDENDNLYCMILLSDGMDENKNMNILVLPIEKYKEWQKHEIEKQEQIWIDGTPERLKNELEAGDITQEQYDFEMAEYEKIKEREKNKK